MSGVIRVKPGVEFTTIAPGGFRLLAAIEHTARLLQVDLTITSACDGAHSGPEDPHHRGEAYDIRTHDLTPLNKRRVLWEILRACVDGHEDMQWTDSGGGSVSGFTGKFFGFLESPGMVNEHLHVQVRKGQTYP